jgi:RHS repeat-associated protein
MQIRHWLSVLCAVTILSSITIAGVQPKLTGGICGGGGAERQLKDGGVKNGDPIYLATGDFQHVQTDLSIPGRGLDFEIKRFYRSRTGLFSTFTTVSGSFHDGVLGDDPRVKTPMGINWDFNYNLRVSLEGGGVTTSQSPGPEPVVDDIPPSSIYFYTGTGRRDEFRIYTSNYPVSSAESYESDEYSAVFKYTMYNLYISMVDSNQVIYRFHPFYDGDGNILPYAGRVYSITDRNGNQITFTYETSNGVERLASAMDTLGNPITFDYHDDPSSPLNGVNAQYTAPLLWKITDHAGRVVEYEYENPSSTFTARMTKATMPNIEDNADFPLAFTDAGGATVDHARFPTGRVWQYEYAQAQPSGWFRDGLLTKITDPNGVIITQNEYDTATFDNRRSGRVIRQQYGADTFNNVVDTYNYVVTDTLGGTSDTSSAYDYYVWVNDRRGAVRRFKYARKWNSYTDPTGEPDQPRNRQLLEVVEYKGFVANSDQRVWATYNSGGNLTGWKYYDQSGNIQSLASGPVTSDGQTGSFVTVLQPNRQWNNEQITLPNGDQVVVQYDDDAIDPRSHGAILSREIRSQNGSQSITESWQYDFDFGSAGGCGCGSQNFDTAHSDGKGYVTIKEYDTTVNALTGQANGNLLTVFHDLPIGTSMGTSPAQAGAAAAAVDSYSYNQWGQVTTHTLPSKQFLDPQGNPATQPLRMDQYDYYSDMNDKNNYGRLFKKHVDVNGIDLVTIYEYDIIGNVIKVTEPDGDFTNYFYNQDAELVREQQYDSTGTVLFAQTDYFYDANGNRVREEVLNLDGDQQLVLSNSSITTVYEYDTLDHPVIISREAGVFTGTIAEYPGVSRRAIAPSGSTDFVSQVLEYDAGRNLLQQNFGENLNGNQPSNVVNYEYDSRELKTKSIRGQGSVSPLVTSYAYDLNGRLTDTVVNPDDPDPNKSQLTQVVYDAFNRAVSRTDPMGNVYTYDYDDNHNPISLQISGPVLDDSSNGSAQNVNLAQITRTYGELDLKESQTVDVYTYDYNSLNGLPFTYSSPQITLYQYNQDSSVRVIDAPSGDTALRDVTTIYYDTASRIELSQDAAGNITQYEYDADSNISKMTQTEVASSGSGVEIYEVLYEYDALDRQVAITDGVGNRTVTKYDSRSNTIERVDARGNTDTYTYDSLSRLTNTSMGNGIITAAKSYDASSRMVSETDDNGNTTIYAYDGLNRMTKITMPDNAFYSAAYDANSNVTTYTDARGVVVNQFFDRNNRLSNRTIVGGIPGTTTEDFTYDGLGRLRTAESDFAKITREYDSRSNVVRELQNVDAASSFPPASDRVVAYEFDNANNNNKITYPGGRVVDRTYDELNRLEGIFNDIAANQLTDPITQLDYIGHRLKSRTNGNGTQTVYKYGGFVASLGLVEIGDMGFGRVNAITTSNTNTGAFLDGFTFTWDANQNRTSYKDRQSGMKNRRERTFGYDAANRLTSTDVDYPDPMTDFVAPTNNGITTYTLDGVHNRTAVSGYEGNGAPLGPYTETGPQAQNNQYTRSPREAGGEWDYTYDENGNLITKAQYSSVDFTGDYSIGSDDLNLFLALYAAQDDAADLNSDGSWDFIDISLFQSQFVDGAVLEHRHYTYDFRNQLVGVSIKLGPTEVSSTTNTYDSAARRVTETVDIAGVTDTSRQFVYGCASLWEMIEQFDLLDVNMQTLTTHVYGLGIDDEINYQYWDQGVFKDIWAHRDDLNSLTSISDINGDVVERYEYGDYGKVSMFNGAGLSLPATAFEVVHLYTGRSIIAGTGLYDYRFRVMEPETGRFGQRDPLWYIDSMNVYGYGVVNPLTGSDPMGTGWLDYIPFVSTYKHYMEKKYIPGQNPLEYGECGNIVNKKRCKECDIMGIQPYVADCQKCMKGLVLGYIGSYLGGGVVIDLVEGGGGAFLAGVAFKKGVENAWKGALTGGILMVDGIADAGIQLDVLMNMYDAYKRAKARSCSCARYQ